MYTNVEKLLPKGIAIKSSKYKAGFKRRPGFLLRSIKGITVHSTANLLSIAYGEAAWLVNPNNERVASWHTAIDENFAVTVIPHNEVAYGTTSGENNWTYIQLEICESGNREVVLSNAIDWCARQCIEHNLLDAHKSIKQHADFQVKNCPRILRDTGRWNWFVDEIQERIDDIVEQTKYNTETERLMTYLTQELKVASPDLWRGYISKPMQINPTHVIQLINKIVKNNSQDIKLLIQLLIIKRIINSPTYWELSLTGKMTINKDYLRLFISNAIKAK